MSCALQHLGFRAGLKFRDSAWPHGLLSLVLGLRVCGMSELGLMACVPEAYNIAVRLRPKLKVKRLPRY